MEKGCVCIGDRLECCVRQHAVVTLSSCMGEGRCAPGGWIGVCGCAAVCDCMNGSVSMHESRLEGCLWWLHGSCR